MFSLFRSFFQTLEGHFVLTQIHTVGLLEFRDQVIDNPLVKIITPSLLFPLVALLKTHHPIPGWKRQSTSSQIIDQNSLILAFI